MVRFENIEFLYALFLVPAFVAVFWWAMKSKQKSLKTFGNIALIRLLIPDAPKYKHSVKFILLAAAFIFTVLGLANLQVGSKLEEIKREGVDIMIAVDVSNSMKAEDIKPNRLESAKQAISRLIDKLKNDRIGLIVFAGDAYLQLPLTPDYSAAKLFLNSIDTDIVPIQGTAIGSAIRLAMKSFPREEKKYKVLVVITDGENHEDDAISEAKNAVEDGVIVHTIGMGSSQGSPIPVYQNNVQTGYRKDRGGNVVMTKLDEQALQQIAASGNGKFIRSTNRQDELEIVLREIEAMEKKEYEAKIFTDYEDRFQYFLGIALFLLLIEFFISERKNKWLAKMNLFGEVKK
ncbi:MAG: VWA domain-containing protein [Bacteroidota bacterium]